MKYLTALEVAERLGCSYQQALKVMRLAGAIRVLSMIRIEEKTLSDYLDTCRIHNAPIVKPWKKPWKPKVKIC